MSSTKRNHHTNHQPPPRIHRPLLRLWIQNVIVAGPVQQIDDRRQTLGEVVRSHLFAVATIHVLDAHAHIQRTADGDDVNVIRFLVHWLHLLVSELLHRAVAVDEVLVEVGALLQLAGRYQAQIDDRIVRVALLVEDRVQLGERGRQIVGRLDAVDHFHKLNKARTRQHILYIAISAH